MITKTLKTSLVATCLLVPVPTLLASVSAAPAQTSAPGKALLSSVSQGSLAPDSCTRAAQLAQRAAIFDVIEEYTKTLAACVNIIDPSERAQCYVDAAETRDEELELVTEQFAARTDLCDLLGSAPYDPVIDPEDFTADITNPFLPFTSGLTLVYESDGEDGLERIEVSLQGYTRDIIGVECAVVRDTATVDGVLLEDTLDYYAQDSFGNVWYFGETALNYDEDGNLEDIDGSWISGVEFAKPGIVMQANPFLGQVYRQEYQLAEAEDVAAILGFNESVSVPFGDFDGCLHTQDTTPLEPDVLEEKYYAPGIGLVLAVDIVTGQREELVDIF